MVPPIAAAPARVHSGVPYVLQTMFSARQMNSMISMLFSIACGVPDIESGSGI